MTQEQINQILKLREDIRARNKTLVETKYELRVMDDNLDFLLRTCDHRFADGRLADNEGYGYGYCEICYKVL